MNKTFLISFIIILSFGFGFVSESSGKTHKRSSTSLIAPESVCSNETDSDATEKQKLNAMFCMANYARKKSGLKKLKRNSKLDWSAKKKSVEILWCQEFSHTACDRKFEYWMLRSKYPRQCYSIAENIAWGSGYLGNVRQIFIAWMKSPPHRHALLSPLYKDSGIGMTTGQFLGYNGAAIWTQHFGKNC